MPFGIESGCGGPEKVIISAIGSKAKGMGDHNEKVSSSWPGGGGTCK